MRSRYSTRIGFVTECRCPKRREKREGDRDEHGASVPRGTLVGLTQATSVTRHERHYRSCTDAHAHAATMGGEGEYVTV